MLLGVLHKLYTFQGYSTLGETYEVKTVCESIEKKIVKFNKALEDMSEENKSNLFDDSFEPLTLLKEETIRKIKWAPYEVHIAVALTHPFTI